MEEVIVSVIGQLHQNIEIILVDDGSVNDSLYVCKKYLSDERIKLISQKNQGVSIARNSGLEIATGNYFFMDSDDSIDIQFISTSLEEAIKEDSNIVVVGEYFGNRFPNVTALPTYAMFLKHSFLKKILEYSLSKGNPTL